MLKIQYTWGGLLVTTEKSEEICRPQYPPPALTTAIGTSGMCAILILNEYYFTTHHRPHPLLPREVQRD